jgi:dienelactone hydrolase
VTVLGSWIASAQKDPYNVLGDGAQGVPPNQLVTNYLNTIADQAIQNAAAERDAIRNPEELAAYQTRQRSFFERQLGGFPERTPLNSKVVGTLDRDTFTVEKVIFESRPDFLVTASLYLPKGDGPFPGVLVPCGHSVNGKAAETYQRASILLALNGMAALCYDPIGQGERAQILKDDGTQLLGSTIEHTMVGVGSILVGTNTAAYRVWDGMRAIDYLAGRPEVDAARIGCTGNSGGGTLTSFLMALDDRIVCAAPSCYITSFDRLLNTIGPQDAEQNWYGQLAHGFDHAEYILTRAPKPTLICAATQDFFDISGTWDTFRTAKQWYTKLGYPERVSLVEVDEPHGFSKGLREAAVSWMARWLLNKDEPVREPEFEIFSDAELQCTSDGQVLLMDGAVSVFDFNIARGKVLADTRAELQKNLTDNEWLQAIRETIGMQSPKKPASFKVTDHGESTVDGISVRKLSVIPSHGIPLPAIVLSPKTPSNERYLIVLGDGKAAALAQDGDAWTLAKAGHVVMAIDVRGTGELESPESHKGWTQYFGPDWQDYFAAYLVGKSFVGKRTEDVILAVLALKAHSAAVEQNPVHVIGDGEAVPAVLHAAAFEPDLFASVTLENGLESWGGLLGERVTRNQLINAVHGALLVYDLPDLRKLLDEKGLLR